MAKKEMNQNMKCEQNALLSWLDRWNLKGNHLVYAIGCLFMVIAGFLPYVNNDKGNLSLMDGTDGIFFLMFSVLMFIFIVFDKEKVVGVLGIIAVYLGAYELAHTFGVMQKTGQAIALKQGYFVLLMGTIIILAASSYFIYRHGLKAFINKIFDRLFPVKETEK